MTPRVREAVHYSLGTVVVGAVVFAMGSWIAGRGAVADVAGGTIVAAALQIAVYWAFFVVALPGRAGVAHLLGMLVRVVAVMVMALWGVGALGLAPEPALLSMVACLFGSTLLEAVFLQRRSASMRAPTS